MIGLYHALPISIRNVVTTFVGMIYSSQKYGSHFSKFLDSLNHNSFALSEQEELEQFLRYTKFHSNFYRDISIDDIKKIPITTKQSIIDSGYANQSGKPYKVTRSSGTTGQPFLVPVTKEAYQREYAFWWYFRSQAGLQRGSRTATIAGHKVAPVNRNNPPFWVHNYFENQILFSSYHLSERNCRYYIAELNKWKPELIHGYTSSLYYLAKYIIENNITLQFRPLMIHAASETVLGFYRTTIEKAFGSKLYIWYGNTELCGHITECPEGKLHVQQRHSHLRVVNEEGNDVALGEVGKIVATNFSNFVFPLINYDTKDIAKVSQTQQCRCGQLGLIIDSIDGRIEDYIFLPDGRRIGRLDHIFKDASNVVLAQIEQHNTNEILIKIVKTNEYSKSDEFTILSEAKSRLGNQILINVEYVNNIEKEKNGKFRFIKQFIRNII